MIRTWTLAVSLLLAGGCSQDRETVNYRLTSKERQSVDTLVSNEVKVLRPYMDSLCAANFDEMVRAATDSIVQLRLEEEARLRSRVPINRNRRDAN